MELSRPIARTGHWLAADRHGRAEVRFVGRGPLTDRAEILRAAGGGDLELAWCRQIHSARAVRATPGDCGEGDALISDRGGLALAVVTADCVPVVISGGDRLAAIHAGWRGIAAAIVPKTLERLESEPLTAWLGPAIGPCCYEVGEDVADQVVAASGPAALATPAAGARPRLDLHRAVVLQLQSRGVATIRRVETCTCCHPERLSSYRRDGERAGRNLTLAWLRA